jgi:peroxiredoxin
MNKQQGPAELYRCRFVSFAAVWCLCLCAIAPCPGTARAQHAHGTGENAAPKIGAAAVDFDLKTLDEKTARLDDFRGKPLVINFFASWCDPCREEMPFINELASKAARAGYRVLGIAVEDGRASVTQYAEQAKLLFPIALDLNSRVKRAYRIFGPPATFFIDGGGVIRDIVIGPITRQQASEGLKKAGVSAVNPG